MTYACEYPGEHHSDDVIAVYHGHTSPSYVCGFHTVSGDLSTLPPPKPWAVQVGMHDSAYTYTYRFERFSQAWFHYTAYHVHSGGKKRLLRNGRVIHRVLTDGFERVYAGNDDLFSEDVA